jgi:drug/metabolite transporter (DMT)-like permease
VVTGMVYSLDLTKVLSVGWETPWLFPSFILGLFFIFTFNLMAACTQYFSVAIASVSSKISLVLPVIFSLLVLKINVDQFQYWNYVGIGISLVSIWFVSRRGEGHVSHMPTGLNVLLLPVSVFVFSGAIDIIINYSNANFIPPEDTKVFPVFAFFFAAMSGLTLAFIRKEKWKFESITAGVLLGMPNYFSIYFLLKALTAFGNDGALLYPVFNMGIIISSSLAGVLIFRERLSLLNRLGVVLAILAIFLVSWRP